MDLKVHLLVESFSAASADEWTEVGVSAHVRVQVRRAVEGFLADDADVRLH